MESTRAERDNLAALLGMAKGEDFPDDCDVTGALLPATATATGQFVARQELIVCGVSFLAEIAAAYDGKITTELLVVDGDKVQQGDVLANWSGPAASVFSAERVALNFLQHLSGIATLTGQYVAATDGSTAEIYDTRKTTPGWRALEKYAVRCGGGQNHRMGLHDAILVKDNHLAALAGAGEDSPLAALAGSLLAAREQLGDDGFVEVEVDTLEQFETALTLPVDVILLDNFSPEATATAVARRDAAGLSDRIALEASGGLTLAATGAVAATGVERIAVGAITHSAAAVDIGLDVEVD
jgi:nicotinate-nucleotide pyrophosphorylase (carboxylating)